MAELATQRRLVDEVDEGSLPVDLDHGQPFPVARLELRVAANVDLLQLETELVTHSGDRLPSPLAEMAADRVVDDDLGYG